MLQTAVDIESGIMVDSNESNSVPESFANANAPTIDTFSGVGSDTVGDSAARVLDGTGGSVQDHTARLTRTTDNVDKETIIAHQMRFALANASGFNCAPIQAQLQYVEPAHHEGAGTAV